MSSARAKRGLRGMLGPWLVLAVAALLLDRFLLLVAMEPWNQPAPRSAWSRSALAVSTGAFHVHSSYSHDGGGSIEAIRAAALKAGLAFVVLTDHNDLRALPKATRQWPGLVVGEEVSAIGGHVVALGVTEEVRAAGPKAGIPIADAIDAITRQNGLAIVAHPSRHGSGWDRSGADRVRGIEIYNADEDWRDDGPLALLGSLVTYPFAPVRSLALLIDRPSKNLALWDSLLQDHDVVGVGACDAHARLDLFAGIRLAFPGYYPAFCVVTTQVWPFAVGGPPDPVPAPSVEPALRLADGLAAGQANVIFRALGAGEGFLFQHRGGRRITLSGGRVEAPGPDFGKLLVLTPGGHRAVIRIYRDGRPWREGVGPIVEESVTEPGIYRCEVSQERRLPPFYGVKEFPWILSNAIRIVKPEAGAPSAPAVGGPGAVEPGTDAAPSAAS